MGTPFRYRKDQAKFTHLFTQTDDMVQKDEEIRWFHPEQETEILEYLRLQNPTHLPSLDTF